MLSHSMRSMGVDLHPSQQQEPYHRGGDPYSRGGPPPHLQQVPWHVWQAPEAQHISPTLPDACLTRGRSQLLGCSCACTACEQAQQACRAFPAL